MYSRYVFDDKLISPRNGYELKSLVNNKNSIKKFGFNNIEELEKEYPGFPLRCSKSQKLFESICDQRGKKNRYPSASKPGNNLKKNILKIKPGVKIAIVNYHLI